MFSRFRAIFKFLLCLISPDPKITANYVLLTSRCNNLSILSLIPGSDNLSVIIGACIAASGLFFFGLMLCKSKKGQACRKQAIENFAGRNSVTPSVYALSKLETESSSIHKEADEKGSLHFA